MRAREQNKEKKSFPKKKVAPKSWMMYIKSPYQFRIIIAITRAIIKQLDFPG